MRVLVQSLIGLLHPSVAVCNHALVLILSLSKLVFKLAIMSVKLVNELHLSCPDLFTPLFELILYLSLDLLLPLLEQSVMPFVSLALLHINALLMHRLVHVH